MDEKDDMICVLPRSMFSLVKMAVLAARHVLSMFLADSINSEMSSTGGYLSFEFYQFFKFNLITSSKLSEHDQRRHWVLRRAARPAWQWKRSWHTPNHWRVRNPSSTAHPAWGTRGRITVVASVPRKPSYRLLHVSRTTDIMLNLKFSNAKSMTIKERHLRSQERRFLIDFVIYSV